MRLFQFIIISIASVLLASCAYADHTAKTPENAASTQTTFAASIAESEQEDITRQLGAETQNNTFKAASGKSCRWLRTAQNSYFACRKDGAETWYISPALLEEDAILGATP